MNRYIFAILSLALLSPTAVFAQWVGPTQAPTGGNTSAPLNVSSSAQTKSGGLLLNTGGAANGLIVQFGNTGLGTVSPSNILHVVGTNAVPATSGGAANGATRIGASGTGIITDFGTYGGGTPYSWIQSRYYNDYATNYILALNPNGGNVGIGTAAPSYKLQSNGDIYANGGWFRVSGSSGLYFESYGGGWHMSDSTWIRSYGSKPVYMSNGLDTGTASGIGCSGGLGGSYMLQVCGAAGVGAAAFYYTSDRSLKEHIAPLSGALEKVKKLQGVSFDWKEGGTRNIGVIAQDVERVYPELVNTDKKTGLKSVEYGNLVAPLIEAIKEQQIQIDALKKEVDALKASR